MDAKQIIAIVTDVLRRHVEPGNHLAVGLSGGLDSVVLLHLLRRLAEPLAFHLTARYVNHQLSANADTWEEFCTRLCQSWQVPFTTSRVLVARDQRKGLEAAARSERYRALACPPADFVVVAQHQDDQAETLLLQLLRGTGIRGLSGMAEVRRQETGVRGLGTGGRQFPVREQGSKVEIEESVGAADSHRSAVFLRPLLPIPRAALEQYAEQHGLQWIEDESNADVSYARNFLRHQVLPAIEKRFPGYRKSLSTMASHCAEAGGLLDDLAAIDADRAIRAGLLDADAMASLTEPRAKNLLRYFIHQRGLAMPDQERLREMLRQLLKGSADSEICVIHEGHELRRFRGKVHLLKPTQISGNAALLRWQGEPVIELRALGGQFNFQLRRGEGIAMSLVLDESLEVRFRRGGERLRPRRGGPSRTLKNLLQESAIPPWQRSVLPCLFCANELVIVPGIGVDARFACAPGEDGVCIDWIAVDKESIGQTVC